MENVFARSGAKAINLFHKYLFRTQLALAIFYFVVSAALLGISSEMTRIVFLDRLTRRFNEPVLIIEDGEIQRPPSPETVRKELQDVMLIVNGVLLSLAGVMGYFLAGLTLEPLKKSYEKEQRFLSDASHELRTPLTILRTSLENIEQKVQEKTKSEIKDALEEVDRMHHLIENLLTLSRAQQNLTFSPLSLNTLAHRVIERTKYLSNEKNIELNFKEKTPVLIEGNERVLEQALTNIVQNAIYYNKKGGSVNVEILAKEKHACIVVTDTGIGMTAEQLHHATERFYRAEESRGRAHGGSGLGLAITEQIVTLHHGTMYIESEISKGTKITLTFPIHNAS